MCRLSFSTFIFFPALRIFGVAVGVGVCVWACHTRIFARISNINARANAIMHTMTWCCWFCAHHVNSCASHHHQKGKIRLCYTRASLSMCLQKQFPYVDFHFFLPSSTPAAWNLLVLPRTHRAQYFTPSRYLGGVCVCVCVGASFADNEFFFLGAFFPPKSFIRLPFAAFPHDFLFSKSKRYA